MGACSQRWKRQCDDCMGEVCRHRQQRHCRSCRGGRLCEIARGIVCLADIWRAEGGCGHYDRCCCCQRIGTQENPVMLTQYLPTIDWTAWHYAAIGLGIIAVACVLGWFFAPLRSFAGAVVLSVLAALYMYKRGEKDQTATDEKEIDDLKKRQPPSDAPSIPGIDP